MLVSTWIQKGTLESYILTPMTIILRVYGKMIPRLGAFPQCPNTDSLLICFQWLSGK
jgi:hypothetical protein